MGFSTIKIIDYKSQIQQLELSKNPFASVILVQLAALERYEQPQDKLLMKINLTKRLYKLGLDKRHIMNLYSFIDWVLTLPEPLEICYHQAVEEMEEENKMRYVTTAERIGLKKGLEQGLQKGTQRANSVLLGLLKYKFQRVPVIYRERVKQANTRMVFKWSKRLLDSQSLEQVFN